MNKNIYLSLACLLAIAHTLRSQCLTLQCPTNFAEVADLSDNNTELWNNSAVWDAQNQSHNLAEAPTSIGLTVTDICPGNPTIQYRLLLDLDGDGVQETIVNNDLVLPNGSVLVGNANTPGLTGGTLAPFDQRLVSAANKYRFVVVAKTLSNTTVARLLWQSSTTLPISYVNPELPYGNHRIEWTVTQNGNSETCGYDIRVKDAKPPVLTCKSDQAIVFPGFHLYLSDLDLLESVEDNTTPDNLLEYGLRVQGQGIGFPENEILHFDCSSNNNNTIEVWGRDKAQNSSFCTMNITINGALCDLLDPGNGSQICTYTEEGVWYEVPLYNINNQIMLSPNGCLDLSLLSPLGGNYTITPEFDADPLNGVTTYDLVLIREHILGNQLLNSPYKMIAADVDKSNTIDSSDIIELKKLILGIYNELPNNTSWRFVYGPQVFTNPANPFADPIQEALTIVNFQDTDTTYYFIAAKVGDVNNTAAPNQLIHVEDRSNITQLSIPDLILQPGETIDIPITATTSANWNGLQIALSADPDLLSIASISAGKDWQAYRSEQNTIKANWLPAHSVSINKDAVLFTLHVQARQQVALRSVLQLGNGFTSEAYSASMDRLPIGLVFSAPLQAIDDQSLIAYSAQPNPTHGGFVIPVQVPYPTAVDLVLFDALGKQVFTQQIDLASGLQQIAVPAETMAYSGVYFWKIIEKNREEKIGKVIRN